MELSEDYFRDKKILITGIHGTGKTFLAKYISSFFKPLIYTPHREEWSWKRGSILAKVKDFLSEFPFWCLHAKKWTLEKKINCFIVDEADLLFKSHYDTSPQLRDVIANHRHWGLTLIFISRRPQDIATRVYSVFEILCLFSIESPQTIDLFNRYSKGLGDMVKNLRYRSYEFVLKHIGDEPVITSV